LSSASLDDLLADARVWRGRQTSAPHLKTLPTGWPALDQALPGGGWPTAALTEVLPEREGLGELGLLLPAIARLTDSQQENAWVAWVSPPHVPYAPALANAGVDLDRLLIIRADGGGRRNEDVQWAAEQTLRSGLCAAVIGWFDRIGDRGLRRLQLAAAEGHAWAVAFRRADRRTQTSPAALRLVVRSAPPAAGQQPGTVVDVIKCRGGRPSTVFCPGRA
jgi:hypothetical protein